MKKTLTNFPTGLQRFLQRELELCGYPLNKKFNKVTNTIFIAEGNDRVIYVRQVNTVENALDYINKGIAVPQGIRITIMDEDTGATIRQEVYIGVTLV